MTVNVYNESHRLIPGQVYTIPLTLRQYATPVLIQVNPTMADGDFLWGKDDAACVQTTNLPTHTANGDLVLTITAAETTGITKYGKLICHDVAGTQWADLNIDILAQEAVAVGTSDLAAGAEMDLVDAPSATAITAIQDGLATPTNITAASGVSLTGDYDAAKTAAQAGDEMDLVDAPNPTAVTAIQSGLSTLDQSDILSDATPFAGANIDAAISTRSTLTAAQVWANAQRTLTSFGTLVADMWSYAWRTLTSAGTAEEETDGSDLLITRGVTYDHTLTGLTVPATWEKLYLTAKRSLDDDDDAAVVQLMVSNPADEEEDGLIVIDGEDGTLADGSLTVDDEDGTVQIVIADDATILLPVTRKATYDLKWLLEDGSSQRPFASAAFQVQATETEAIE